MATSFKPAQFVIEHMEEDDEETKALPGWVILEYSHMLSLAPSTSTVHFTSLSSSTQASLSMTLKPSTSKAAMPQPHRIPILDLLQQNNVPLEKCCLLDPRAEKEISVEDGEGEDAFEYYLFGGILGDDPPLDRTSALRKLGFPSRHLGPIQMTTDTALGVVAEVVCNKTPLSKIPMIDHPTITFNDKESVEMPFIYIEDLPSNPGQPKLPPGMREHLKKDLERSFEF